MQPLYHFLNHPVTTMVVGAILLAAGIVEFVEEVYGAVTGPRVHHALIVFGVYMALQGLLTALSGSRRHRLERAARESAAEDIPGAIAVDQPDAVVSVSASGEDESVPVMRRTEVDPTVEPWRADVAGRSPAPPGPDLGPETPTRR